jgi:hypothetical protein
MRRTLILWLCSAAALWATACGGGGGGTTTVPPPNNGFSNNNLAGQYAFYMSGTDASTGEFEPYARVGSFSANGSGLITGGVEDVNLTFSGEGSNEFSITGGNYTVNSDGTGSLSLIDSTGTLTFAITLTSSTAGYIVDFPTDGTSSASGSFVLQNTSQPFSLGSVSGNYAFDLSGVDSSGNAESVVGQMVSNGTSTLSGFADANDGGSINGGSGGAAPISGSYGAPPISSDLTEFGRGLMAIGGVSGVFYIVNPNQLIFMEESSGGTLTGSALIQSSIPTTTAGVNGPFVYVMGGSTVTNSGFGPLARGGKFSASSGNLSSVIVDTNNAGSVQSLPSSGTGTGAYTIDPTVSGSGRGTITFTLPGSSVAFNYVFYMVSPTQAFVQDQSAGPNGATIEDGSMFAQGSSTISASSLAANYGLNWSGVTVLNGGNSEGEEDVVGEATLSSASALTGTVDINDLAGSTLPLPGISLTGGFTLNSDPTSHNAVTITLATNPTIKVTAFAYVAANNNILLLTTENVRIAAGVMTPQNP